MTVSELARDRAAQLVSITATIPHRLGYHPHGSIVIQPLQQLAGQVPLIHLPLRPASRPQAFAARLKRIPTCLTGPLVMTVFSSRLPEAIDLRQAFALTPQRVQIFGGVQVHGRSVALWWDGIWQQSIARKDWQAAPSATAEIVAGSNIAPNRAALALPGPSARAERIEQIPTPTAMATAWRAAATGQASVRELTTLATGLRLAPLRDSLLHEAITEPGAYPRFQPVSRGSIAASYERKQRREMSDFGPHFAVLSQVAAAANRQYFAPICAAGAYLCWYGAGFERAEVLCAQALQADGDNRLAQLVRTALYAAMNPPWAAPSAGTVKCTPTAVDAPVHAVWW